MDGWMDGWMDGRTDGRKDKQTPETLTIRSPPPAEIDNWNEAKLTPQASTVLPGTPWLYRVLQNFLSLYRQICLVPLQTPRILKHGKSSRSAKPISTVLIDDQAETEKFRGGALVSGAGGGMYIHR